MCAICRAPQNSAEIRLKGDWQTWPLQPMVREFTGAMVEETERWLNIIIPPIRRSGHIPVVEFSIDILDAFEELATGALHGWEAKHHTLMRRIIERREAGDMKLAQEPPEGPWSDQFPEDLTPEEYEALAAEAAMIEAPEELLNMYRSRELELAGITDDAMLEWVQDEMRAGTRQGESYETIANRIQQGFPEFSDWRATNIARTETAMMYEHGQYARMADSQFTKGYRWVAIGDERTCPICRARHDTEYAIGKGPVPPAHCQCRCTTVDIFYDEPLQEVTPQDERAMPAFQEGFGMPPDVPITAPIQAPVAA